VISPNVIEAEELVGHEFNDEEDRAIAVREMVGSGPREAIMTGARRLLRLMRRASRRGPSLYRVRGPRLEPRATVGSGDAFIAGFVAARYQGRPPADCLGYAVATGVESTQHLGAGVVDPGRLDRALEEIVVERPALPAEVG
jgi:1-phosphofructokinase/tagatose 6-phosphate kinase